MHLPQAGQVGAAVAFTTLCILGIITKFHLVSSQRECHTVWRAWHLGWLCELALEQGLCLAVGSGSALGDQVQSRSPVVWNNFLTPAVWISQELYCTVLHWRSPSGLFKGLLTPLIENSPRWVYSERSRDSGKSLTPTVKTSFHQHLLLHINEVLARKMFYWTRWPTSELCKHSLKKKHFFLCPGWSAPFFMMLFQSLMPWILSSSQIGEKCSGHIKRSTYQLDLIQS